MSELQHDLLSVVERHRLNVGVGRSTDGVVLRSQDSRLDARNVGKVLAKDDEPVISPPPNEETVDLVRRLIFGGEADALAAMLDSRTRRIEALEATLAAIREMVK